MRDRSGSKPDLGFTPAEATALRGKHLLVGITHVSLAADAPRLEQFHGTIMRINLREGLVIRLHGSDEERSLPPDLTRLERAAPGRYRLKSTGESVENPDFTVTWTLYPKDCAD